MKHLDLFSGIGGFAYAANQVWDNVEHTFCEIDPFCQKILKKHYPNSKIYGDIRTLRKERFDSNDDGDGRFGRDKEINTTETDKQTFNNFKEHNGETLTNTEYKRPIQSEHEERPRQEEGLSSGYGECYLLTGGFPCQPFSQAGRRKGTSDDRFLWPEMLRVIREFKPTWVIAENVRGILSIEGGLVFQQVCVDLENEGYDVQPIVIPACAIGAPHRRDRVWFIANFTGKGLERCGGSGEGFTSENRNDTDTASERCNDGGDYRGERPILYDEGIAKESEQERHGRERGACKIDVAKDPVSERSGGRVESCGQVLGSQGAETKNERSSWERHWIEVATELCRVDDGLSPRVDGLSTSQHRTQRLKSLGNAIVPQVAIQIMKAIYETTRTSKKN